MFKSHAPWDPVGLPLDPLEPWIGFKDQLADLSRPIWLGLVSWGRRCTDHQNTSFTSPLLICVGWCLNEGCQRGWKLRILGSKIGDSRNWIEGKFCPEGLNSEGYRQVRQKYSKHISRKKMISAHVWQNIVKGTKGPRVECSWNSNYLHVW